MRSTTFGAAVAAMMLSLAFHTASAEKPHRPHKPHGHAYGLYKQQQAMYGRRAHRDDDGDDDDRPSAQYGYPGGVMNGTVYGYPSNGYPVYGSNGYPVYGPNGYPVNGQNGYPVYPNSGSSPYSIHGQMPSGNVGRPGSGNIGPHGQAAQGGYRGRANQRGPESLHGAQAGR